jgi:metal-responsive CopG/Arc/MetJ family transcriptional regulator
MILPEDLLMKVDTLAGGKHRRSVFIETAIRAYIASEEKKALKNGGTDAKTAGKKAAAVSK